MLIKIVLFLLMLCLLIDANNENSDLIAIVKVSKAKVRSKAIPNDKYIVDYYKLGDVLYLDYCDKYDWCKQKDTSRYLSKATIGVMHYEPLQITTIKKQLVPTIKKQPEMSCIVLQQIDIHDSEIFSKNEQEEYFQSYFGECIDASLLKEILNKTSQYYIDEGYITTKPYLTEQNIQDGQVDIAVSVGYVGDIVHNETNSSDSRIITAFMFQKNEPLNLRDLETSLEMMNRVPSYGSKFSIKPAKEIGQSIVSINTEKQEPYRFAFGIIGEKQDYEDNPYLNADLSIDNLLNINDILTLRYNGSKVQSYYQSTSGAEVDYSFPLSSYVLSYTWFKFKYSQAVEGLNDKYRSNGDTVGSNLKVNKILYRTQNNKVEASISLQYKDNKNYFSNELIDVSSYKTTLAQVDFTDTYFASWGQLSNTFSYYRGTDWFGARDDSIMGSDSDEKLQFTKFSFTTNLFYNFPIQTYQLNSNAHIQYSQDFLYDNNKLRVGSYYTVRGYEASYYGNNAYYIRNDFIKHFYSNFNTYFLQTISPFIGLDYGSVKCEKNTQSSCGWLAGSAIGFKTAASYLDTEFTLSRGLKQSNTEEFKNLFRYSLTFKY